MQAAVSIIIINWNGLADTRECLDSLALLTNEKPRIIVVDNGSSENDAEVLRREYPEAAVLEAGANLGFTGGNNLGLAYAMRGSPDYIFLLNNDTLAAPDFLANLLGAAEQLPEKSVLTPAINYLEPAGTPWFVGSTLALEKGEAWHDNSRVPAGSEPPIEIPWASGCAMLFPAAFLQALGGFDDRYFLNWEDVDLSLRARAAGGGLYLVPAAQIIHKVGRSFSKVSAISRYYSARNNLLLVSLHGGQARAQAERCVKNRWLREALREVKRRKPGAFSALKMTLKAFRDHRAGRYGKLDA